MTKKNTFYSTIIQWMSEKKYDDDNDRHDTAVRLNNVARYIKSIYNAKVMWIKRLCVVMAAHHNDKYHLKPAKLRDIERERGRNRLKTECARVTTSIHICSLHFLFAIDQHENKNKYANKNFVKLIANNVCINSCHTIFIFFCLLCYSFV